MKLLGIFESLLGEIGASGDPLPIKNGPSG